ncbi:uncharacterized protein LOC127082188 [Lathyrus oleraceus]|uniref:uncharacterized protein LOC127082188 n=1 Tax=Pisum sativum TaxID=3888 RepID=UPI0021D2AF6D|nr:uncharacterized protein LOC127082188 [Pisum sativum]
MHFNNYVDHREMRPFDEIVIYSRWLVCMSRLTTPHLFEHIMWKFDYTQTIPRHTVVSAPPTLTRRQVNVMFDYYESHMVSEETRSTIAVSDWSYIDRYIRWFFKVSHSYMVHAVPRDLLRPACQEIVEEEHEQLNHAEDVLPICRPLWRLCKQALTGVSSLMGLM